jgi:hypothetical protein
MSVLLAAAPHLSGTGAQSFLAGPHGQLLFVVAVVALFGLLLSGATKKSH